MFYRSVESGLIAKKGNKVGVGSKKRKECETEGNEKERTAGGRKTGRKGIQ